MTPASPSETREVRPAAHPAVLDMAISRVTLARVAAGELPACSRIFVPRRTLALAKADLRRPGVEAAAAAARRRAFTPVVRLVGGQVVAYHEQSLIYEQYVPRDDGGQSLRSRYEAVAELLVEVLSQVGVRARIGAVEGEYCPGDFSVNVGGRVKLAGLGQRQVARAAVVSASLVVGRAGILRETLREVSTAMRIAWAPPTLGAVEDFSPGIRLEEVKELLRARSAHRSSPCWDPDEDTLARARECAREFEHQQRWTPPAAAAAKPADPAVTAYTM